MNNKDLLGVGSRVVHPSYGPGVIIRLHKAAYDVTFSDHGVKQVGKTYSGWDIIEAIPVKEQVSFNEVETALVKVLKSWSDITHLVELGSKWTGGEFILQPGQDNLQPKKMPIETFFHKIVMVRDRIRVMEQKINSSVLSDEEKIHLQQYITRIYGSLTSFNVLFEYKEDHFKGAGRS